MFPPKHESRESQHRHRPYVKMRKTLNALSAQSRQLKH